MSKKAIRELVRFKVDSPPQWPRKAVYGREGYEKGDENAPFFTEAFLYNLIGKEDARSLLGIVRELCMGVGLNLDKEIDAVDEGGEEKGNG